MRKLKIRMDGQIAVLAVAEKGSFEAAGKYLGVTKSAVRKRVHGVDNEVGTPMFHSVGKRMMPTRAGTIFLSEARESVRHASLGLDQVRSFLEMKAHHLRIGYSSYLSEKLLTIIRQLHLKGDPPDSISRESLLTRQIIVDVLHYRLDVGFGFLPIKQPELFVRQLMVEPLMVCLPAGHRLSAKHEIQPEELENEPLIAIARKALPGRHEDIVAHFESLGVSPKFVADAYLAKEALWLVSQGVGLTLLSRSSASGMRPDLVLRPFSDRLLTVKSGLFVRQDHNEGLIHDFIERAWTLTAPLRPRTTQTDANAAIHETHKSTNGRARQRRRGVKGNETGE